MPLVTKKFFFVLLILSFLGITLFPSPASSASIEPVTWIPVNLPADGIAGNWVLADGSDAQCLTMAPDGTLYCYANPSGTTYTLFKSLDGGSTWSFTGKVKDAIVAITVAADDSRYVYYATSCAVYRSTDAGNNFVALPLNPGSSGANNVAITSIAVTLTGQNTHRIACATSDTDAGQFGGVYQLDENQPLAWQDTNIGNYDVCSVAFSPTFIMDQELFAIATNEADTWMMTCVGSTAWGSVIGDARLNRDNTVPPVAVVARGATIAFPGNYEMTPVEQQTRFVAIDTSSGNGDVYRVNSAKAPSASSAVDLNVGFPGSTNIDISSLAASGEGSAVSLMAGAAASSQVYFSPDSGKNWTFTQKEPTGQTRTRVIMGADFAVKGIAYAATSGSQSAVSYSADRGKTWNQRGLIDNRLSSIIDFVPSPAYNQDNTLFLLTQHFGGKQSLWRSHDGGLKWERIYSSALANVTTLEKIAISPRFETDKAVFAAGSYGGSAAAFQSLDGGQMFNPRPTRKPVSGGSFNINAWAIAGNNELYIAGYDGSNNYVYHSENGGFYYTSEVLVGAQVPASLYSVA